MGRDVTVVLAGLDVEVARAHAEGVLRGAEEFPGAGLEVVGTYGADSVYRDNIGLPPTAYGVTVDGTDIMFNTAYGHIDDFSGEMAFGDEARRHSGPAGDLTRIGIHEYGHVVARSSPGAEASAKAIAERYAGTPTKFSYVKEHLSGYATTNEKELFAEAFVDVVSTGGSAMSREIVDAARGGTP